MTLSMRVGHLILPTHFGPRRTYIYISHEISIEHPSVGLALLAQLTNFIKKQLFLIFLVRPDNIAAALDPQMFNPSKN